MRRQDAGMAGILCLLDMERGELSLPDRLLDVFDIELPK